MKVDTIVTLDGNERYYLVDKTEQDGKTYYLATKLKEDNTPLEESQIFEEIVEEGTTYLETVADELTYNQLAAIFVTKFNDLVLEGEI